MTYTEGTPTVPIYRLWSAITGLGGILERRVWMHSQMLTLYPSLFTLLVGTPGTGKTNAIRPLAELWRASGPNIHISPSNMTRASLLDGLEAAKRVVPDTNRLDLLEYHTMLVAADEFGVLCPAHDLEFLSVLNTIFDCPPIYEETRRFNKTRTEIIQPQLIILAGTQPGFLASMLPETAWSMGFTSRLIMIYSGKKVDVELFTIPDKREDQFAKLQQRLLEMTEWKGEMIWTMDAQDAIKAWYRAKMAPVPMHSKLAHYNERRGLHVMKLSMIASASRGNDFRIEAEDFIRARDWLLEAEQFMPDVFREMVAKSDGQVIMELHYEIWKIFNKTQEPVDTSTVWHFLASRVPADKILRVMDAADHAKIVVRLAGTNKWIPLPLDQHGVE